MRFVRNTFGFSKGDWSDPDQLRAKVLGAVARYRADLAAPERSEAAFAALHDALAGALASEGVPDAGSVALGLLLQALDQHGIEPAGA